MNATPHEGRRRNATAILLFISALFCWSAPSVGWAQGQVLVKVGGTILWEVGTHLAGFLVDKLFLDDCFDEKTGHMKKAEMEQAIKMLKERDQAHTAEYMAMASALRERMTRQEVEGVMMKTLEQINPVLAEHTRQIRSLEEVASNHRSLLKKLGEDAEFMRLVQAKHGAEIKKVQADIAELQEAYPRYTPGEQARILGASGFTFLLKRDNREAMRAFRMAHGFEPDNPGYLYGLAIAYRRDGQRDFADMLLATGIAKERTRTLKYSAWWRHSIERFQGPDRQWLEQARWDPIYGVRVRGMMRVPDVDLAGLKMPASS